MNYTYMKGCALCMTLCLTSAALPGRANAESSAIVNEVLQSSVVKGVVKDSNGEPLLGVNVLVKGTTIGAVTDIDGNFSFEAPAGCTLVISYIGFESQEVKVKGNAPLNIILKEDSEALDEVVVVGYGVQKKSDVTGALSSVKGDDLIKLSISRTDQALQGQMAGVMVQNSVAAPGESPNIIIRGGNSLKGENAPLVVIDGVLGGDLSLIDPNDITSIEVLKDASSTSIYGSRGANGVIMVTTKRGQTGKPTVSYSGYVSLSQVSKKMDMLNGQELYGLLKEAQEKYPTTALKIPEWIDPNNLNNTDWQDEVFRTAPITGHSLSVSGGTETTRYSLSGNYLMHQGIVKNSDFNRAGIRANIEQKLGKKVTVGALINASRSSSSNASVNQMNGSDGGGVTFSALGFGPLVPVYKEDGSLSGPLKDGAQMNNPVALINDQVVDKFRNYFQGTAFLEWEILSGLKFKTAWTYTYSDRKQRQFTSGENLLSYKGQGYAYMNDQETTNWLGENTLTYSKTFNKDHSLNVVAGFTAEASDYFNNNSSGKGFDIESLGYWNMGLANSSLLSVASGGNHSAIASWLGRVNYAYKGKYLASVSFRADGSSKFAKNNKWGYFPSFSAAWRVSEEKFMKNITPISNLKLRLGWGTVGNDRITNYLSMDLYSSSKYGIGQQMATVLSPKQLANKDLKWEGSTTANLGIDVGLLDNRLNLTADFFLKNTKDLLLEQKLAYVTGFNSQWQNIGKIENKGIELNINSTNIQTRNFLWQTDFNISFIKNTLKALQDGNTYIQSATKFNSNFNGNDYISIVGSSLGQMYGYVFDGVYQTSDFNVLPNGSMQLKPGVADISKHAGKTVEPGMVKYKDIDGDGVITPDDRTTIGNGQPDWYGGITNTFNYKNIDFSFMFQFQYGNDVYNATRMFNTQSQDERSNQLAEVADRWTPTHASNRVPSARGYVKYELYSRFVEDGSFLRLKNITLGYTFPNKWTRKAYINRLRVYGTAQNLFCLTKYSGYDPEVNMKSSPLMPGFDWGAYPKSRVFTFGVEVQF